MKHNLLRLFTTVFFWCFLAGFTAYAQTTITGTVTDAVSGDPLPGVNVKVEGTISGTITNGSGQYTLNVRSVQDLRLIFSFVGYESQLVDASGTQGSLDVQLAEQVNIGEEVVVSASRVEEKIMESPVTIEKMDILAIQQSATPDFYDGISKLKGVQTYSGSLTLTSINTRGFATIANTRFVQLIDGMDNSAPLLNFPTGNIVGISDLDVESVELVPGAASALYGPNAFNGILMMQSKSPFDYQGLSANVKIGVTNSSTNAGGFNTGNQAGMAHGTNPYYQAQIRYAKSLFKDKLAFKVNFSYLSGQDWRANDYTSFRTDVSNYFLPPGQLPGPGNPNFDGLNLYGDETNISMSNPALIGGLAAGLAPLFAPSFGGSTAAATAALNPRLNSLFAGQSVNRTGFREQDILDNNNATSIKADAAIHYRITDKLELSYNYRIGSGNTVYQGGERYALRDFNIQFHKLELKGKNFFVRGYMSQTGDGNSYNLSALGAFANERLAPTGTVWFPNYAQQFTGNIIGQLNAAGQTPLWLAGAYIPTNDQIATAHAFARAVMDNGVDPLTGAAVPITGLTPRPAAGSQEFNTLMGAVRADLFKRPVPGAGFVDQSRLYHGEFNYNFKDLWSWMEIQVGGNFRRYDLFSNNTVYNEVREAGGQPQRITIDEFGAYVQLSKRFIDDHLKVTASLRLDKNQNFAEQFNPRVSAVYTLGANRQHNIRASFQTGLRIPDTQAQFIFFPASSGILLGGTQANAARYGIFNGGATDLAGNPINLRFIQPERLYAYEVGYKGIIGDKLMLDLNYYYNTYENFVTAQSVRAINGGADAAFVTATNPTGTFPAGQVFRPYFNSNIPISSQGAALGLTYKLPKTMVLYGNYSWNEFSANVPAGQTFEVQFNTPQNRFTVGVSGREVAKNLGFDISYRWQERFIWQNAFANGVVPGFGVLDAMVSYKVKDWKTMFKVGANNLLGQDYRTNFGGPWVGQLYYISITFDEFLR